MKLTRFFSHIAVSSILSLSLIFTGCSTATPPAVTLGVILPMDESSGPARENALRTAIDEINEAGGVADGRLIHLTVKSSEGDNREVAAADVANALLASEKNLVGLVTAFSSSSKGVALQVADPMHIPQISGTSTSDSNSGISPYFQRLAPRDDFQALIMARKARQEGIRNVSIAIQKGDAFSEGLAKVFQSEFSALGGVISNNIYFVANDPAYKAKLTQLYTGSPDAVFISMVSTDVQFLQAVDQSDIGLDKNTLRFLLSDAQKRDDVLNNASAHLLTGNVNRHPKSFGAVSSPNPDSPAYTHFAAELTARYNQNVESFNAQFYDIGYLFALAIEKAAATVNLSDLNAFRESVNANLRPVSRPDAGDITVAPENGGWAAMKTIAGGVNYEGASGNCDIDKNGDVLTQYEVFSVVQNSDQSFAFKALEQIDPN